MPESPYLIQPLTLTLPRVQHHAKICKLTLKSGFVHSQNADSPRWNFKHSNPSGHLSAPKFSEEVEVCELQGRSSRCPSLHALSPACAPWQLVAVPPVQLKTLSPSSVLVPGPAARATGASRAHLLLEDALWFAASLGRQAGAV